MIIKGIKRGFKLTIGGFTEICELCKDGDISNVFELLTSTNQATVIDNAFKLALILNKWDEKSKQYEDSSYVPNELERIDLDMLSVTDIQSLIAEIQNAIVEGMKTQVETELPPQTNKGKN